MFFFIAVRNRQQMFLSGFVQDMTKIDSLLPERVYLWMLDECMPLPSPSLQIATAYIIRSIFGNQGGSCICIFWGAMYLTRANNHTNYHRVKRISDVQFVRR